MNFKLIIGVVVLLILGGIGIPLFSYFKEIREEKSKLNSKKKTISNTNTENEIPIDVDKDIKIGNSQDLLEFESIEICNEDQALVKVNDTEYLAYIEVGGVSFNLLSDEEKLTLEENYGNLLNGIDYEFQNFIQSRSLNLDNYISTYRARVESIKTALINVEDKLDITQDAEEKHQLEIKSEKLHNQYEYGMNLLEDFYDKNVDSTLLERRFFIILKYYHDPEGFDELSDHEVLECAYNDLIIKANLFIDVLERNNMSCKFLNGLEIAELLYNSFNKDDASSLKIDSAVKARYNHLCTTSQSIENKRINLEKQKAKEEQEKIQKEIVNLVKAKKKLENKEENA